MHHAVVDAGRSRYDCRGRNKCVLHETQYHNTCHATALKLDDDVGAELLLSGVFSAGLIRCRID